MPRVRGEQVLRSSNRHQLSVRILTWEQTLMVIVVWASSIFFLVRRPRSVTKSNDSSPQQVAPWTVLHRTDHHARIAGTGETLAALINSQSSETLQASVRNLQLADAVTCAATMLIEAESALELRLKNVQSALKRLEAMQTNTH
jgi:hypothetical protein